MAGTEFIVLLSQLMRSLLQSHPFHHRSNKALNFIHKIDTQLIIRLEEIGDFNLWAANL